MARLKKKQITTPKPSVDSSASEKAKPTLTVAFTQQTLDEQRLFDSEIKLLLSEWVRQKLHGEERNGPKSHW